MFYLIQFLIYCFNSFTSEIISITEPRLFLRDDFYKMYLKTTEPFNMPYVEFIISFNKNKNTFQKYFFHFNDQKNGYLDLSLIYYNMKIKDNSYKYISIPKNTNFKFKRNENFLINFDKEKFEIIISILSKSTDEMNLYNYLIEYKYFAFQFILSFYNNYLDIKLKTTVFRICNSNLILEKVEKNKIINRIILY